MDHLTRANANILSANNGSQLDVVRRHVGDRRVVDSCPLSCVVRADVSLRINTDALLNIAHDAGEEGNFHLARQCYERGAALGDALCLHALGYMYDVGEGVTEDKALAMKFYRRAWRRGSHASASNIAILYRDQGKLTLMFRWFQRVANAGDGSAQLELAKCFLRGAGVRKDPQAALRCLAAATKSSFITEHEREAAKELLDKLRPHQV